MSPLDRAVLAERTLAVRRHLARVDAKLPEEPSDLEPSTDASDAVILHLWQATQIVIDLAVAASVGPPRRWRLHRLRRPSLPSPARPTRQTHQTSTTDCYDKLDMARVHRAATSGPADLLAFLAALERVTDAKTEANRPRG